MLLYIIRHGEPYYPTDSLTAKGKLQADALAKRLALHGLDKIYTSPMGRAKLTAQPTCDLLNLDYEVLDWMHEHGKEFCLPINDIQSNNNLNPTTAYLSPARDSYFHNKGYPFFDENGMVDTDEARAEFAHITAQADQLMERHGYQHEGDLYKIIRPNDDKVALFCHGGFGRTLIAYLLCIPPKYMWISTIMNHTGVTVIRFANETTGYSCGQMMCYSDISHLYAERLPMEFGHLITDIPEYIKF